VSIPDFGVELVGQAFQLAITGIIAEAGWKACPTKKFLPPELN
jgi:hypothetical protein